MSSSDIFLSGFIVYESYNVSRKQQRLAAVAIGLVFIFSYGLYSTTRSHVTWQSPAVAPVGEPAAGPGPGSGAVSSPNPTLPEVPVLSSKKEVLPSATVLPLKEKPDPLKIQETPSAIPESQPDTTKDKKPASSKTPAAVPAYAIASSSVPASPSPSAVVCMNYEVLQRSKQQPWSKGWRKFPYSRPPPECRTFKLPAMEKLIDRMKGVIKDPDLSRLFENSYPNTLDTMIKWRGYAGKLDATSGNFTDTDEELTYVITGDIDAMWLRDSASQIYSYLSLLEPSTEKDSLASLWRGLINIHARYIIISPYCHSFQPPPESGLPATFNGAYSQNHPNPPYDPSKVFDCKWELDSLASFLQISVAYYERTKDIKFFEKYNWIAAVKATVDAAGAMRLGTYGKDGAVLKSAWPFTGYTNRGSKTLTNDELGNPSKSNGMVRTAFRPSDDACIYQFLVPANMMFAKYLEEGSKIMEGLEGAEAKNLTNVMRTFAYGIRKGIDKDGIITHPDFGDMFAYEVDGYGSANLMDDANVPSLLAMPLWNYTSSSFSIPPPPKGQLPRDYKKIYLNTRQFVLSESNPYFMHGPVLSAIGGPHLGPGKAWPMAAIVRALTAYSTLAVPLPSGEGGSVQQAEKKLIEDEIKSQISMVLNSTHGTGVIHESVNSWLESDWTRAWFGWANGLFGELMIKVAEEDERHERNPGWLGESWQ